MLKYLRAIGFSQIRTRADLRPIVQEIAKSPMWVEQTSPETGVNVIRMTREYGDGFGISIVGENVENDFFPAQIYPCARDAGDHETGFCQIEEHVVSNTYSGDLDFDNLSVIFHIQNISDALIECCHAEEVVSDVCFHAFSTEGKVLLPIRRTSFSLQEEQDRIEMERNISEDSNAAALAETGVAALMFQEEIRSRIRHEDVLSIVDNTFLPVGVDCECYQILGDIEDAEILSNYETGEQVYMLHVQVRGVTRGLMLEIFINEKDLLGEPAPSRRFSGTIWLSGSWKEAEEQNLE